VEGAPKPKPGADAMEWLERNKHLKDTITNNYFASSDPHQLGLQMSGICGVCICSFHLLGRPSWRPGAPDVGDMWGLYLFFSSVGAALLATWGSSCRGYVGSVSVLFICWGGPLGDLGLQMSGICGVCICCFCLLWRGRKRRRRGAGEAALRSNPTTPV
jgi:hypothetical protein